MTLIQNAHKESIGIQGIAALHRFCFDLESNRRFLADKLDFEEIAVSGPELEDRTRQKSAIFNAGNCMIVCTEPLADTSAAGRYLKKHPEGVGAISLEVADVEHAHRVLDARGGTPISDVQRFRHDGGDLGIFAIATPLDDVRFHLVERRAHLAPLPGFVLHDQPTGGKNAFGFSSYDHVTANFQTMAPMKLWFEHVLGLEQVWDIEFHTSDILGDRGAGSGLRSVVMADKKSGIKFANNEPFRPNFDESQVALFCDDQRGNGIQHAALVVDDIVASVRTLRERGVRFVETPGAYYDNIEAHLERAGVKEIDEDVETLRELEILVDGTGEKRYLLQIFMEDAARFEGDTKRSPFFFELIQRKGCPGFGAGNFRALFEGVERAQEGRTHA